MFTDVELGLAIGASRAIRGIEADAQAIVDSKNRQIAALQRQLAVAQREIAALKSERTTRNRALFTAAVARH